MTGSTHGWDRASASDDDVVQDWGDALYRDAGLTNPHMIAVALRALDAAAVVAGQTLRRRGVPVNPDAVADVLGACVRRAVKRGWQDET